MTWSEACPSRRGLAVRHRPSASREVKVEAKVGIEAKVVRDPKDAIRGPNQDLDQGTDPDPDPDQGLYRCFI